jgi:[acyl-carrier-protein] S-malonyltransferase
MGKIAFVFPGQASQVPGMGRDLYDKFPAARHAFETADAALGLKLSEICFNGSDEVLQLTENTQPTILTVSLAAWAAAKDRLPAPDYVAGHSLGEYSALVAAGALPLADAVRTVRQRGQFMQAAVPLGVGAMAAIIGLDEAAVNEACAAAAAAATGEIVSAANLNAPGQVVIAGHAGAVEKAMAEAKNRGAKMTKLLNVSAPFHCALMKPAAEKLAPVLNALPWNDPRIPLVNNVECAIVTTKEAALEGLIRQVASPVRWEASMKKLAELGVDTFVEIGPLRVLSGLMKRIVPGARILNVEDEASLNATAAAL